RVKERAPGRRQRRGENPSIHERAMLKPSLIDPHQARRFGVAPGWWAVDEVGRPILGPHCSRERVLMQIGFAPASGRSPALPPSRRQLVESYATRTAEAAL